MKIITLREAINQALMREMEEDDKVILLGEDIGLHGGAMQVTVNLFNKFGADRVIDTPLSEYALIGAGIGSAFMGIKPVVEIMFTDFITLIADQLINNAAKACYTTEGEQTCPLVVRTMYGAGSRSGPHHSQSLEGLFMGIPGIKMVAPSNPADAYGLLRSAIRDPNPVIYFEHKRLYGIRGPLSDNEDLIPLEKAKVIREGSDLTLITYGAMVQKSIDAAKELENYGISVEIIDLRTIKPFDKETIITSLKKTGRVILVQEACKQGGASPEIAAMISEEGIEYLDAPIGFVSAPDTPVPFSPTLEDYFIPKIEDIIETAKYLTVSKY